MKHLKDCIDSQLFLLIKVLLALLSFRELKYYMYLKKKKEYNSDVIKLTCIWWIAEAITSGFQLVGNPIMVCQTAAIMEILHPMLGLVKSGAIAPLMQVWTTCIYSTGVIYKILNPGSKCYMIF